MSSDTHQDIAIKVQNLSKCYHIYNAANDRLKQFVVPRLQSVLGQQPKVYFKEFWSLKDVSFSIKKGETVGIIGQNGSGKSTLLQMICGTVSPTMGSIQTYGRVAALLELGAGFNTEFTGRENVLLNAAILGFPRESMEQKMDDILAFSELGEFLDQPVKTYSSGMYARLAFSIAIHVDPDILIIDEALSVGDARFVAKCMRRINDIKTQGATILFVSHDVGSIRTLCDRAIWLEKGKLVEDGDVFPITGRFMEFMFKDEIFEDDIIHNEIVNQSEENKIIEDELPQNIKKEDLLDSRPVTHWGSKKGIIVSAAVCDKQGIRQDVHAWGGDIVIRIQVSVPAHISREHLSVACSIKDLKGTDLLVSTTYDFLAKRLPDTSDFIVSFCFKNYLVTGKYLLVAAVENRLQHDIHYYEYVEGAHYFASLADARLFGQFQPVIEQQISEIQHD